MAALRLADRPPGHVVQLRAVGRRVARIHPVAIEIEALQQREAVEGELGCLSVSSDVVVQRPEVMRDCR